MSEQLKERERKFQKMGIPTGAGTYNQVTTVVPQGKQSKFQALEALKRGAKRDEYKQMITAEKKGYSANEGFQIPEPKQKRKGVNPNAPKVDEKYKVGLDALTPPPAKGRSELSAIEAMFDGGIALSPVKTMGTTQQISIELPPAPVGMEEWTGGVPEFDPLAAFQKRMSEKKKMEQIARQPQTGAEFEVIQSSPGQEIDEQSRYRAQDDFRKQQEPVINYYHLKDMITDIASEVAEKKIKEILELYAKKQSQKKVYEVYNKEKNIVKINDKFFKLQEVRLVNKKI